MHDIDRTLAELQSDEGAFETDSFEYSFEGEPEFGEELDGTSPLSEVEEMDQAANLLEVTDEAELDQFLGGLMKKAGRFMKSPAGKMLGGILKKVAKKALPMAARMAGGFFGGPAGAAIGGQLGGMATKLFEVNLEGMSAEDQEFEVAKRFVRFAAAAAKNTANAPATASPSDAVKSAIVAAAKAHAPGLISSSRPTGAGTGGRSGRWIRRGNRIILLGA